MIRFFLLLPLIFSFAYPCMEEKEVKNYFKKMLDSHIEYKSFSKELAKRSLKNFIEELDPSKTYFLEEEVTPWTNPTDSTLNAVIQEFESSHFSTFKKIHAAFEKAVKRRNENPLIPEKLPQDPPPFEKELPWAKTEEELLERLHHIHALQKKTAQKISFETEEKFLQRIAKQRSLREKKIISSENKDTWIITHIVKALTSSLDNNSCYFTPAETRQFLIDLQQKVSGIGAVFRDNLNGFFVVRVLENSPASLAGLKIEDLIIAVDKEPVLGLDTFDVAEKIRGKKGTSVLLTVLRENASETVDILITREEIVLQEARLETTLEPFADGIIATLKLSSFYKDNHGSSSSDIQKKLEELKKNYLLKGVILDLRNNAGGLLQEAVALSGLFLESGIVASIKDSSSKIHHLRNYTSCKIWDGPLLILTNKASASASEVVAQSLQDYGRALVVGDTQTYGKGTFQGFSLNTTKDDSINPKGECKITQGKYYTVSGKSPQLVGVSPDVEIPSILCFLEIGERFFPYPIKNDAIAPCFSEIPFDFLSFLPKYDVSHFYKKTAQKKLSYVEKVLPVLKKNSLDRLKKNILYQKTLENLEKKNFDTDWVKAFEVCDAQWLEAKNVIKDWIFLIETRENCTKKDADSKLPCKSVA